MALSGPSHAAEWFPPKLNGGKVFWVRRQDALPYDSAQKFTRVEIVLLWIFATFLVAAGAAGIFLSAGRADGNLALASLGILGIAAIYVFAARGGKPL